MKSFKRLLSLAAIVCIGLTACQKEFTIEEDPGTNPPATLSSDYLSKFYYIDSTAGVKDTFRIVSYEYDAQKRVVQIVDSGDIGPAFSLLPERSYQYSYNGSDTIPFKSLYQKYSWPPSGVVAVDSQTIFHFYDAQLNRVKDSVSDFSANASNIWYTRLYTYTATSITEVTTFPGSTPDTTVTRVDARGNIILGESDPDGLFTYEFDNNPSPFARLSNFKALRLTVDAEAAGYFYQLKNTNNFTKNTDFSPSQSLFEIWDLTGDYNYRTDGYPARIKDEYAPGQFEIIEFKYILL